MNTIMITKNPFAAIRSVYSYFAEKGAKDVIAPKHWKSFLRSRIVIFDSGQQQSPQFRFQNPVQMWNNLNWNHLTLNIPNNVNMHIQYEALLADPARVLLQLADAFGLEKREQSSKFKLPENRVKRLRDERCQEQHEYVSSQRFNARHYYLSGEYMKYYDTQDKKFVLSNLDAELLQELGYAQQVTRLLA